MMSPSQLWERFEKYYSEYPSLGLSVDLSRVRFPDDIFSRNETAMQRAYIAMAELEKGGIANPDERRMVGHYWLRKPALAPTASIQAEITQCLADVHSFSRKVHEGELRGASGTFQDLLVVGIGGSALGPQFVAQALGMAGRDRMRVHFFDNTDPDGFDKVLAGLEGRLGRTLCIVISKSGGTKETRNGMREAEAAWERAGLLFSSHALAVTGFGSELDQYARKKGWIARFPMWDWVGGRTSETAAVGLLPAALQGFDIDAMLAGARACDEVTRGTVTLRNPAAQLALMWHFLGDGRGGKDMVVLPYKDRLELFSKYLQQLVMESLGKELDLDGKVVNQGISVYGNKGSTDQHAYVQQLREGVLNFFVVFIEVLRDRSAPGMEVEPGVTSGDYLNGFFQGTRTALYEKDRQSITLSITEVNAFSVGVLIALFERAVGLYASLVRVNAYHQPGVEAGKKAAGAVIALQREVAAYLAGSGRPSGTAGEIAKAIGRPDAAETVFRICLHLANNDRLVEVVEGEGVLRRFAARRA